MRLNPVDFLKRMLEIYSPTGEEEELATFLLEEMERDGFDAKMDSVGNVVGKLGDGKPRLLLCGHMDTVPGFLPVKVLGGEVTGRGAVDAKGPLAAMVMAAKKVANTPLNGTLIVSGVVDEEGSSRGVKELISSGVEAEYAVFGEPSNARNVVIGYKGNVHVSVNVRVKPGHPANPNVKNASEEIIKIWGMIKEKIKPLEEKTPLRSLSCSIESISGGRSRARIDLSLRVPFGMRCKYAVDIVENTVKSSGSEDVKCWLEVADAVEPYESNKHSRLVTAFRKSVKDFFGEEPRLIRKTGTGDMNYYGNHFRRADVVTYGPGDPRLDHTEEERINIHDYLKSIGVLEQVIKRLLL